MKLTLQELELLKTATAYNGAQHKEICGRATLELIEYKKIEEELGVDLITLFKALTYGIYVKFSKIQIEHINSAMIGIMKYYGRYYFVVNNFMRKYKILINSKTKQWALTKEELL